MLKAQAFSKQDSVKDYVCIIGHSLEATPEALARSGSRAEHKLLHLKLKKI